MEIVLQMVFSDLYLTGCLQTVKFCDVPRCAASDIYVGPMLMQVLQR